MNVAGIDPGRNTAAVIVDGAGVVVYAAHVELDGDMIKRAQAVRRVLERVYCYDVAGIVIEDVSLSATIGGRKGGERRHPKTIGSVQRDFGLTCGVALWLWPVDRIMLALVAQWYPRIRGQMVKKELCLKLQKQRAEQADEEAARLLKNEHLKVAYGLAMYGQGSRRFLLSKDTSG